MLQLRFSHLRCSPLPSSPLVGQIVLLLLRRHDHSTHRFDRVENDDPIISFFGFNDWFANQRYLSLVHYFFFLKKKNPSIHAVRNAMEVCQFSELTLMTWPGDFRSSTETISVKSTLFSVAVVGADVAVAALCRRFA